MREPTAWEKGLVTALSFASMDEEFLERKEIILRKLFSLVIVLLLCSFPVLAQTVEDEETLPIVALVEGGCYLTLNGGSVTSINWTLLLPETATLVWEPSIEGEIAIFISHRLLNLHKARLMFQFDDDLLGRALANTLAVDTWIRTIWTDADIPVDPLLIPASTPTQIWESGGANGTKDMTVSFEFMNGFAFADTYDASCTLTVLDMTS